MSEVTVRTARKRDRKTDRPKAKCRNPDHLMPYEVATLCGCAPRTVIDWFDRGLIAGFKLPAAARSGYQPRRFVRSSVIKFMRAHGIPIPAAFATVGLPVGCHLPGPCPGVTEVGVFELARRTVAGEIGPVVIGTAGGFDVAVEAAAGVRAAAPGVRLAVWLGDDRRPDDVPGGLFDAVVTSAVEAAAWAGAGGDR